MKSNNILERKYAIKMGNSDERLAKRINLAYYDIFETYKELDEESKNNLRIFIDKYFSKLRPTEYKKKKYKNELDKLLYPEIYFVGLAHLYSNNGLIQYALLKDIYKEIDKELNNNIEQKRRIK